MITPYTAKLVMSDGSELVCEVIATDAHFRKPTMPSDWSGTRWMNVYEQEESASYSITLKVSPEQMKRFTDAYERSKALYEQAAKQARGDK